MIKKAPAQKIRDYLIKKYAATEDIFVKGKAFTNVQMSKMRRYNKKK